METTKIDLLHLMTAVAKQYRKVYVTDLEDNRHLTRYDGEKVSQSTVDAILIGFINKLASQQRVMFNLTVDQLKSSTSDGRRPGE